MNRLERMWQKTAFNMLTHHLSIWLRVDRKKEEHGKKIDGWEGEGYGMIETDGEAWLLDDPLKWKRLSEKENRKWRITVRRAF
jgi:hypothetical protein